MRLVVRLFTLSNRRIYMQFYAKFETGVGFSATIEPNEGFFPVITTKNPPNFEILVFDELQGQWVEDSNLEASFNETKAKQDAIASRIRKQEFGSKFLATVVEMNVVKFESAALTQNDLIAMDTDASLQAMERAAWRGNISTLKALVQSYSGIYYTTQEKTDLIALIDSSGLA
jgi:hypothetical protein